MTLRPKPYICLPAFNTKCKLDQEPLLSLLLRAGDSTHFRNAFLQNQDFQWRRCWMVSTNIQFVLIWKVRFSDIALYPHRTSQYNLFAAQTFPFSVSCLHLLQINVGIVMYSSYVISYSLNPELCGGKEIWQWLTHVMGGGKGRVKGKGDTQLLSATKSLHLDSGCNDFCNYVINTALVTMTFVIIVYLCAIPGPGVVFSLSNNSQTSLVRHGHVYSFHYSV